MKYCKNCVQHILWNSLITFATDKKERKASNEMDCISPKQELKKSSARLEEKLQSQCPFQKPQKGPVQEERGGPTWQWKQNRSTPGKTKCTTHVGRIRDQHQTRHTRLISCPNIHRYRILGQVRWRINNRTYITFTQFRSM